MLPTAYKHLTNSKIISDNSNHVMDNSRHKSHKSQINN